MNKRVCSIWTIFSLLIFAGLLTACSTAVSAYEVPDIEAIMARVPIPETMVEGDTVTFTVNPEYTLQTIRTTAGGNFINKFSGTYDPIDPVSLYNLNNLDVQVARVRMTLEEFEVANDNDTPRKIEWSAFKNDGYNQATFILMQELQARDIEIVATFWNVPDWMVYNPQNDTDRLVDFTLYDELAECVTAWLVMARDEYGVEVDYVSVNEPNIGADVSFMGRELTAVIEASEPLFKKNSIKTRWLLADTSNASGSTSFGDSMLKNGDIADLTGPFAFHSWDFDADDSTYYKIREYAWGLGRPVWCTEGGHKPFAYSQPEFFPTWDNALGLSHVYNRVFAMSGTEVMLYWEMMAKDFWLNNGEEPFYAFEAVKLFNDYFPNGTVVVDTSDNTNEQFILAGQAPEFFSVHLVNLAETTVTIVVESLPDGDYELISFTEADWVKSLGTISSNGGVVTVEMGPESVMVLVGN